MALAMALAGTPGAGLGQTAKTESPPASTGKKILQSENPLKIASDRMEVSQNDRTILFEGHVVVQQDDLTITGKRLRVYGASEQQKLSQDATMMDRIDRIEVDGDVKISQRDRIATSDRAVYYHAEQKIVLSGQPAVTQGQDRIQGRLITLYTEQGKSVVEGGEDRPVQAILHPNRKD
jgi:lipopolysaccharide export system protein LptA